MPLLLLIFLFVAIPVTEFAILFELADSVGLLPTIALVLLTGVLGATLAKQQGLQTLTRIRQEMAGGKMPGDALFDGALILIAGAVLITPGILTDAFGFSLLIPPLRAIVKRLIKAWAARNVRVATSFSGPAGGPPMGETHRGRDEIIDAEVIETRVERGQHACPQTRSTTRFTTPGLKGSPSVRGGKSCFGCTLPRRV